MTTKPRPVGGGARKIDLAEDHQQDTAEVEHSQRPRRDAYAECGRRGREAHARAHALGSKIGERDLKVLGAVLDVTVLYSWLEDATSTRRIASRAYAIAEADVLGWQRDNASKSLRRLAAAGVLGYKPGRGPWGRCFVAVDPTWPMSKNPATRDKAGNLLPVTRLRQRANPADPAGPNPAETLTATRNCVEELSPSTPGEPEAAGTTPVAEKTPSTPQGGKTDTAEMERTLRSRHPQHLTTIERLCRDGNTHVDRSEWATTVHRLAFDFDVAESVVDAAATQTINSYVKHGLGWPAYLLKVAKNWRAQRDPLADVA